MLRVTRRQDLIKVGFNKVSNAMRTFDLDWLRLAWWAGRTWM